MLRRPWIAPLVLAACFPSASQQDTAGPRDDPPTHEAAERGPDLHAPHTARALLPSLPVREHTSRSGYGREHYGPAWADADRNGCDTREDILRRDLGDVKLKPGTRDCVVVSGTLMDPYTGTRIRFEKGGASEVDIDHVVALGNAWVTGAASWPFRKRVALANDPLNLLAAQASANRAKGDSDAATWLPPDPAAHCVYVARQVAVKEKYDLWITPDEHEAMMTVLATCPEQPAPVSDAPTTAPINPPEPGHAKAHARPKQPAPEPPARAKARAPDPNYGTCKQVKANHAGPYVRGRDPEYAYYRDTDGDGIVCE